MDTKLHEAVRYCDTDSVVAALKENFDPNLMGVLKWTPVQEAARAGERDILFHLLTYGGDPNMRDGLSSGNTALHFAASEGHLDCLRLLLQNQGNATLLNAEGKTCLQVASLENKDAIATMLMELGGEGGEEEEQNNNERKMIRRPAPTDTDKWNSLPEVPKRAEMGYLHLSFEYHRGALKVRVWQISDLLLPPPQISMIHSIFVRGYFMPDQVRKTQRRTEEIVVDIPQGRTSETPKTGIQHIFTPSSFKFSTPLMYTGVTAEIVKQRSLQLEVCMTQKHSRRIFLMAMVHMPLRTAVRRPIREKYPLIPCMNITIPNNMRVYSAVDLQLESSKGGHFRANGRVVSPDDGVPPLTAREVELEDVVSLSGEDFLRSHLSLCLDDDDSDDDRGDQDRSDDGRLREVRISNGVDSGGSSTTTLYIASSGDEGDEEEDEDDVPHVVTHSGRSSARDTPVDMRFVDTNSDSNFKKKIIPNELLQNDDVPEDIAVDMPSEDAVIDMEGSYSSDSLQKSHVSPAESVSADLRPTRRKIIPVEVESQKESELRVHSSSVTNGEIQGKDENQFNNTGRSQGHDSPKASSRKKKIMVLPGDINIPPDSLHPASHNSTDSDGLSPRGRSGSEISPTQDSAFTPLSRPETPCWDFYDFAEDLQPEEDLEGASRSLEASLAQLRQQGIGSLQNLSKEPILPMVLVDDFDTLAVDAEQAEMENEAPA